MIGRGERGGEEKREQEQIKQSESSETTTDSLLRARLREVELGEAREGKGKNASRVKVIIVR